MSTRAKILKIVGCYWGRDWDATGTLLGRYCERLLCTKIAVNIIELYLRI